MSVQSFTPARRWRAGVSVAAAAALTLMSAPAFADNIVNTLDGSVDSTAEVMPLNAGGADGSTQLFVDPANGDGKSGCNLTGSTTLVVKASSSNTAVATVPATDITFDSCGAVRTLAVTPHAAGTASITLTQQSNNSGGSFDLSTAKFTVNVTAAASNTAPTVVVAGVDPAASYNKGSVPAATCEVTDAEDGNSSFAATLSEITGPYAADGIGSQTASCSYTDDGDLTASASETYDIVDPTGPVIDYVLNPAAPNTYGWYTGNVTLTWSVTDPESPNSIVKTGCDDQTITLDQVSTEYSCSATSAGGSTGPVAVSIAKDGTKPTIGHSLSSSPNGNGWFKDDVTVTFSCDDATSLIASCLADGETDNTKVLGEGEDQSVTGTATDNAGNTETDTASNIDIDKTAPSVALTGGPADGGSYYFGSVPGAPSCNASDALSGIDGTCNVSGYGTGVGTHTVTATATDRAGNANSASATYTVLAWTLKGFYAPVDMGGVYNTVKGGSTVPLKFEIFAGSTEITDVAAIDSFVTQKITCSGTGLEDALEVLSTGGTSLRYDATGGQFIQNWKTPTGAGTCYKATMTADDGSSITAFFKIK